MAYVVATKPGRFEVRESVSTPDGPRSRTLASFREMTVETIKKAQARSDKPPTAAELIRMALRAGAPVRRSDLDEAAGQTLRHLASGEQPDPKLRRLLIDALVSEGPSREASGSNGLVSDAARAASQWIGVGIEERGTALRELLELADALPVRLRPNEIGFPYLRST